jgi:hypothetical protein
MTLRRIAGVPLLLGVSLTLMAPAAGALTGSVPPASASVRATIGADQPNPLQPVICALKADAEGCKKAEPPK